jgi:hypothetical protein
MSITLSWDNDGDYEVDIDEDDFADYFSDFYGIDKDTAHSIVSDFSLEDVLYDDDGFIEFLKDRYYDQCHDTTEKDDERDYEESRL